MSNLKLLTEQEKKTLDGIPMQIRIDVLEEYWIGKNGVNYTTQELGVKHWGGENYSHYVSLLQRAYGMYGTNSGRYAAGKTFYKNYGYLVTKQDIKEFVTDYPQGSVEYGYSFEDFVIEKAIQSQKNTAQYYQENEISFTDYSIGNTWKQETNQNDTGSTYYKRNVENDGILGEIGSFIASVCGDMFEDMFEGWLELSFADKMKEILLVIVCFLSGIWMHMYGLAFKEETLLRNICAVVLGILIIYAAIRLRRKGIGLGKLILGEVGMTISIFSWVYGDKIGAGVFLFFTIFFIAMILFSEFMERHKTLDKILTTIITIAGVMIWIKVYIIR